MTRIVAFSLIAVVGLGCVGASRPTVSPRVSVAQQSSASASMGFSFPPETQFHLYHRASEGLSLLPGNGDKQDPSFFAHYHLSQTRHIDECLATHGISANDITDVILTHFHFDHVGGAINKAKNGQLVPTFPKATYWTNQKHYDWSFTPNPRERASFLKENFVLLQELGILKMIDATGDIVRLDEKISFFFSYGHTEAMMIPIIDTPKGKLIYCADLLPSNWHIGLPYIMAYDIRPFESLAEKIKMLDWALDENAV